MSEAIISGVLNKGFLNAEQIFVTNRSNKERLSYLQERYQVQCVQDREEAVKDADVIVLSMQPFDLKAAVQSLKNSISSNQLIISVAAGVSTDYISNLLNLDAPIIRANPSMLASIGDSATSIAKGITATDDHLAIGVTLFQTIGTTVISEEADMHIVTGLAGSGPAYIYYLAEAMEKAAIELGLNENIATELISQTFLGAGKMLQQSGDSAKELKEKVISPEGTTEAGINSLIDYEFEKIVYECIKSARDRSVELGGSM
jgi:pyrroline-5-carboxylate reductase